MTPVKRQHAEQPPRRAASSRPKLEADGGDRECRRSRQREVQEKDRQGAAVCIKAISKGDDVSDVISQVPAVSCIQEPVLEMTDASSRLRNSGRAAAPSGERPGDSGAPPGAVPGQPQARGCQTRSEGGRADFRYAAGWATFNLGDEHTLTGRPDDTTDFRMARIFNPFRTLRSRSFVF